MRLAGLRQAPVRWRPRSVDRLEHSSRSGRGAPQAAGDAPLWQPKPEWTDGKVHTWTGDHAARYLRRTLHAEVAATALLPEEISRLLAPLDEREREILKLRFGLDRGEPRTLEEVGEHFNLTRERIRQIEARAMSKLRHPSSDTGARDLLAV